MLSMNSSKTIPMFWSTPGQIVKHILLLLMEMWALRSISLIALIMSMASQILSQKPVQTDPPGVAMIRNQHGRIDIFNRPECQQGPMSQFCFQDFFCNRECFISLDLKRTLKSTDRRMMSMILLY